MCGKAIFVFLCTICLGSSQAQKRWDGEGGDSLWHNPINWHPNGVPEFADDVLIDNSLFHAPVWIRMGTDTAQVNTITLRSSGSFENTLHILAHNTRMPALRLLSAENGLDIGMHTKLINSSGAPAGNPIEINGKLAIRNGGTYVHNTVRGNAYLAGKLLADSSTAKGIFIFDVPGSAGYTVSLTGRRYGSLHFMASVGRKSYSGTGSSDLNIGGDLVIGDSAALTSAMTARIILKGGLSVSGRMQINPVTADSTGRLIEFAGDSNAISIPGIMETGINFRGFELRAGVTKMLTDIQLATGSSFHIKQGAILEMDTCSIRGNGIFRTEKGSLIVLEHQRVISDGSVAANIMTRGQQIHKQTGFWFTGSENQTAGNLFPDSLGILKINKIAGDLWLEKPILITDSLILEKGVIRNTDSSMVTLAGKIKGGNGVSFIGGPLQVTTQNTNRVFFPVGDSLIFAPLMLQSPVQRSFNMRVKFTAKSTPTGVNSLRFPLKTLSKGGWQLNINNAMGNNTDSFSLSATLYPEATTDLVGLPFLAMLPEDSSHWQLAHMQLSRDSNRLTTPYIPIANSIWTLSDLYPVALSQQNIRLSPYQTGDHYSLSWELDNPESFTTFHIEISDEGQIFRFYDSFPAIEKKVNQKYTIQPNSGLRGKLFFRVRGLGDAGLKATSNVVHLNFEGPMLLYPNPGSNKVFISCRFQDIRQITILDALSKTYQIQTEDFGNITAVRTSHLPPGIYRILLLKGQKWQVFSFVKR
jgi:hypothetical protein